MSKRQKKLLIALSVFLVLMILINRNIRSSLQPLLTNARNGRGPSAQEPESKPVEVFIEENSKYHLAPDDPAEYNIKVQDRYDIPLTEQQWEYRMRQSLRSPKNAGAIPPESLAGIHKTPEEIEERISDITAQIKSYEAIVLNNPADRKSQDKLQTLYMLKATLTALKDKVASQPPVINSDQEFYER